MAQSQMPPTRPPLPQTQTQFPRDFAAPNGRPSPLGPQSPQMGMNYSSPSPQQFSPQAYNQPPAAKRPRLSPDAQSPFSPQSYPPTPSGQPTTPGGNVQMNGTTPSNPRQGLMPPPQRPSDKAEDRNYEDILSGTGINIEEEARMLVRPDYYGTSTPRPPPQSQGPGFQYHVNGFNAADPGAGGVGTQQVQNGGQNQAQAYQASAEEIKQREEARADWEASRHSQHPLWDMFLLGGTLNDKIRSISITEHLIDPQSGVLVNTQKHAPPPTVRVNGLEGATRIIDKGQAILDTGAKGERLSDIMKVISLATKARMTGLVNASARLAQERRLHSKGKVPDEWQDIAAAVKPATDGPEGVSSPAGSASLKRTHSQANSEGPSFSFDQVPPPALTVETLDKVSLAERSAEEARRQRRAKRRTTTNGDGAIGTPAVDAAAEAAAAAAMEAEKKTTKKERKLAESKFSEQQQHKSANEAARMAFSGLLGNRFGSKKQRTYDWMKGGGGSPAVTPGKPAASTTASVAGTPGPDRARAVPKEKHFGQWDEDQDAKIQARDVFLVLEGDGRASRSYVRGQSLPVK
ncbi:hypothetical protein LTR99_009305 [Exophiala xenobiotica]|uniref:Transcription initiation factor TFIID subunit 4 n=1 Tax=Vermiconidia calcicola TaxID=1690605 RepID=A0AAV9PWV5_9PEZI|nr:hypothetical protein LTR41_003894 [Exophiala xenobiotica]KAK5531022.1 hypothetical protein LTR25_008879 [Vermiconidia calcicola]KAK5536273.1 hypothetical protein LTR23_007991 [Chaetothyriales sp. CCFEE 6169]KAK5228560.1 hypothetical protein LTR72_002444 [Exophiala xenobiotica]KAK5238373.1 hypothetical protein LTR47_000116 [Exophiala xenobiotica]